MRFGLRPFSSCAAKVTVPSSGGRKPLSKLNSVVLPAPFGPMMPRISPSPTVKLAWATARKPPKDFERLLTVRIGWRCCGVGSGAAAAIGGAIRSTGPRPVARGRRKKSRTRQ